MSQNCLIWNYGEEHFFYLEPCNYILHRNADINLSMLSMLGKITADDILIYFSYFFQKIRFDMEKIRFDISCKLSPKVTICMQCQILFSGENKKNMINLSSAEFGHRIVKVNANCYMIL